MRAQGELWLPRETRETPEAYTVRLRRSFLMPGLKKVLTDCSSKPFNKQITYRGQTPKGLEDLKENADNAGTPISAFAKKLFLDALTRGVSHVLVDYPVVPPTATREDEVKNKIRPYFVHIPGNALFAWRQQPGSNGGPELEQIRWKEQVTLSEGEFGERKIDRIRVLKPKAWEVWEKTPDQDKYERTSQGPFKFPGNRIPLVTVNLSPTGFMTAIPPFEELAWVNLAHWQSKSDQNNILRFIRFAILFQRGVTDAEMEKEMTVGPTHLVRTTNTEADLKFVEHTGKAVGAGKEDLESLEQAMEILGLEPYLRRVGNQTATARSIDKAEANSLIQEWIMTTSEGLRRAYAFAAEWLGETIPKDFAVELFSDFGLSLRATSDIDQLIKLHQSGNLSRRTLLTEVKKRALLDEMLDVDKEIADIEAEGPKLGEMDGSFMDEDGKPKEEMKPGEMKPGQMEDDEEEADDE